MNLAFVPEQNLPELIQASKEYTKIWVGLGQKIIDSLENITKLKFTDRKITATVFEGISSSHPLKLRASYSTETKKATLIHELGHVLLTDNRIKPDEHTSHQLLFLFLYDVWCDLFGYKFANEQVLIEKKRADKYKVDWEWVLTKTMSQREQLFFEVVLRKISRA